MKNLQNIWRTLTTTRYVRQLQDELDRSKAETERLRLENRAMLNNLLIRGGWMPIEDPIEQKPVTPQRRMSHFQQQRQAEREAERGGIDAGAH